MRWTHLVSFVISINTMISGLSGTVRKVALRGERPTSAWFRLFLTRSVKDKGTSTPTSSYLLLNLIEGYVTDSVLLPIFVIEVPPFGLVDFETLRLHCIAQQVAVPALQRSTTRIVRISAISRLVVSTHHGNGLSCLQIVERYVDSAATIVTRPLRWIGNKFLFVVWCRIPKHLRYVPGTVCVMDQQSITHFFQLGI